MVPHWDHFEGTGFEINESLLGPWDKLFLDGKRVPGTIPPGGIKCVRKMVLDIKKPHGGDGGRVIQKGYDPAKVDITVRLCTSEEWDAFQVFMAGIWRLPGKDARQERPEGVNQPKKPSKPLPSPPASLARQEGPFRTGAVLPDASLVPAATTTGGGSGTRLVGALDIESPYLAAPNKVSAVFLETVSNPEPGPEKGTMIVKITAVEYVPQTKKSTNRKGVGKAAQVPEHQLKKSTAVKNAASLSPSVTDGLPKAPPQPASGSS